MSSGWETRARDKRHAAYRFALDLDRLRLGTGLSIRALSRRTGCPVSTLGDALRGRRFPRLDTVLAVARECSADVEYWRDRWVRVERLRSVGDLPAGLVPDSGPLVPASRGERPSKVVQLLGDVHVRDGERAHGLGGVKQRSVLAVLLYYANRVVPRQKILDLLWDVDEQARQQSAQRLVPSYLSRCRDHLRQAGITDQQIGLRAIRKPEPGYRLTIDLDAEHPPVVVDWHWFRRLCSRARAADAVGDIDSAISWYSSALALWRGRALAELGPALDPIRMEMDTERLAAAEALVGRYYESEYLPHVGRRA